MGGREVWGLRWYDSFARKVPKRCIRAMARSEIPSKPSAKTSEKLPTPAPLKRNAQGSVSYRERCIGRPLAAPETWVRTRRLRLILGAVGEWDNEKGLAGALVPTERRFAHLCRILVISRESCSGRLSSGTPVPPVQKNTLRIERRVMPFGSVEKEGPFSGCRTGI